jgi:hypothetical protein
MVDIEYRASRHDPIEDEVFLGFRFFFPTRGLAACIHVYIMRAFHPATPGFVYWPSPNEPDPLATLAPFPLADLEDIVISNIQCRSPT